ncbi:BLUF domain-containing protein [Croceivirga thetidis]|uniref:BLUF domain-containing protein n=1 Tax=Croceivirga thetidis TaxID=2721623 RepID=A0ABX1GUA9_9FLAO|nr:BLUF domain-containing protein [Croceivirga thetidis]NKI33496.1 BLUF domain-containing protein [Croceivirga thetidis]
MNGSIESFLYLSKSKYGLCTKELDLFAQQFSSQNRLFGITGFLYYNNGYFIQYFEGSSKAVLQLKQNIQLDSRHVVKIWLNDREKKNRRFPDWSMNNLNDILKKTNSLNNTLNVLYSILLLSMQNVTNSGKKIDGITQRQLFEKVDDLASLANEMNLNERLTN